MNKASAQQEASAGFRAPPPSTGVSILPWEEREAIEVWCNATEVQYHRARLKLARMRSRGDHAQRTADGGGPMGLKFVRGCALDCAMPCFPLGRSTFLASV